MKHKTHIILILAALFTGILYLSSPRADEPAPRPRLIISNWACPLVVSFIWTEDGRQLIAITSTDLWLSKRAIEIWDAKTGRRKRIISEGVGYSLAVSPDGKTIATGHYNGEIVLLDTASGRKIRTLRAIPKSVPDLCFSPDGKLLAATIFHENPNRPNYSITKGEQSSTADTFIYLISTAEKIASTHPQSLEWEIPSAILGPPGQYDLRQITPPQVSDLYREYNSIGSLTGFNSKFDSAALIAAAKNNSLDQLPLPLGETVQSVTLKFGAFRESDRLTRVSLSRDRKRIALCSESDCLAGELVKGGVLRHTGTSKGYASFSPDGKILAMSDHKSKNDGHDNYENSLFFLDPASPNQRRFLFTDKSSEVNGIAYDERAGVLAVATGDSMIKFFNTKIGGFIGERVGSQPRFSPDGGKLIYSSQGMLIVDPVTLAEIKFVPGHFPLAMSSDGNRIVRMPTNTSMEIVDLNSSEVLSGCTVGWNCGIVDAVFTDNQHAFAAAGSGICEDARLFDLNKCKEIGGIHVDNNPEPSVYINFSPGGRYLLTTRGDGILNIYHVPDLKKVKTINLHSPTEYGPYIISRDSRKLAVRIYDEKTGGTFVQTRKFPSGEIIHNTPLGENDWAEMDPGFRFLFSLQWGNDPGILFRSVDDGHLFLRIALRGGDWIVTTPEGFFDASEGAKDFITWQVGTETYPADKFWKEFYRPGLLAEAMKDQGPVK